MCKAFSAIIDRNRNVYWKRGMDSHEEGGELWNE